jgi:hypothetical protein
VKCRGLEDELGLRESKISELEADNAELSVRLRSFEPSSRKGGDRLDVPGSEVLEEPSSESRSLGERVRDSITKIFSLVELDMEEIKEGIWSYLSSIYFKYADEDQREDFRVVLKEIFVKIREDKWEAIYQKIYSNEK